MQVNPLGEELSELTHFWPKFSFCTLSKTTENLWFRGVFRGYKMGILTRNGFKSYIRIERLPIQTALGSRLSLGTHPCYAVPSDLCIEYRMINRSD